VYPAIDAYWDNLVNGTTLNADTLDGLHATDFVQQDSAGNVIISGNLETAGDTIVKGINVLKTFPPAIPEGSTAYFKKQLIDELAGITPDGYNTSTVTSYGLRTSSDNATLVVTERKDDVPFTGVTSFAVEEGTTNLFTNPTFQNGESGFDYVSGWSSRTIKDGGPLGRYIELVDSPSDGGSYGATFNVTPGQTYTFSVYINVLECQGGAVELYYNWLDANGNFITVSTSGASGEEMPSDFVGQGWRRYKITDTAPEDAAKVRAFVHSSVAATSRIQVTGFQIEEKPFATSFVDGTRADGRLAIPINFRTNLVISGWFKPYGTSGNYNTQGGWARIVNFSNSNDTRRVTLAYNRRDSHPDFQKFQLSIYNASGDVIVSTSNVYPFNKWYFWVLIIEDASTTAYIFDENGNMEKIVNTNSIPISDISSSPLYIGHKAFGTTDVLNGVISNLLIARYDPTIWTDEYIRFLYEARKPFYV
jgi:hypothetical protein